MTTEELVEEYEQLIEIESLQFWDAKQEGPDSAVLSFEHVDRKQRIEDELIYRKHFVE